MISGSEGSSSFFAKKEPKKLSVIWAWGFLCQTPLRTNVGRISEAPPAASAETTDTCDGPEVAEGASLFRPTKVFACLLLLGFANAAHAWGLPDLMLTLTRVHSASANFTERKTMQLLNAPLITSGTLHYVAPDYVAKTTILPAPENFVLDRGVVTMSDGATEQKFAVAAQPQIGGLVEAIRATLAGDLPALQRYYNVQLTGDAANWQILLRPKDAALARFVQWIIIQGNRNRISAIDTASGNGDHSEMGVNEIVGDAR